MSEFSIDTASWAELELWLAERTKACELCDGLGELDVDDAGGYPCELCSGSGEVPLVNEWRFRPPASYLGNSVPQPQTHIMAGLVRQGHD